ncbi:MAG: purine/pyrimidine permease [Giesbergeria sp.]|nr:purine/pyrimidine permease [Giesbergeria sp.]MBP6600006.1 purine/pyrimidine permease [Giesbergeria sp.]
MGFFRFAPSPARRRPADWLFGSDDRVPGAALWLLAAQHAATAMAFITYVLATAQIAGLDRQGTQSMVAMTLLGMALCTGLQAWGGRLGSGLLLVHMPNPFVITVVAALVVAHGPGGMAVATLIYGSTALLVGPLVQRMRALFPPAVAGTVVCMGGLGLVEPAMRHALGVDAQWAINPVSVVIASATLGCIVLLSVWGGRRTRLLGLLAGIVIGVVVAAATGELRGLDTLGSAPVLALPHWYAPVWQIDPALVVALVLVSVLTQLDMLGSVVIMDKMEDADWKRANMQAVGGGIRANGVGDMAAALLGAFPSCVCSANIALAHATRSTARAIGLATALLLALVAFLPQATLALTLIPAPVLGAVELYAAGFLIVSGIELIASRAMDSRGIFTVGLSISAGLTVMLMPELVKTAPQGLQFLLGSSLVVAGLLVVALNMLFRLGTAQRSEQALDAASARLPQDITDFVERQGAAWGARRAVVQRAAQAALEGAEAIAGAGARSLVGVRGSFDEFNLDIELLHRGAPLQWGAAAAPSPALSLEALLEGDGDEGDAALDAALRQVSGVLLRHLADRIGTTAGTGTAPSALCLHFDH